MIIPAMMRETCGKNTKSYGEKWNIKIMMEEVWRRMEKRGKERDKRWRIWTLTVDGGKS